MSDIDGKIIITKHNGNEYIKTEYEGDIMDLPKREDYEQIDGIYCNKCNIGKLPNLPKLLEVLSCTDNTLTELPELPNTLIYLLCNGNKFISLPELPNSLELLHCHDNEIIKLPKLSN